MNPSIKPRVLGISGSLRKGSYVTAILRALAETTTPHVSLDVFTLHDVPPYDQDADTASPPPGVTALRAAIGNADGIIIGSPEYNAGMSGVLKNALDWASRPYGKSTLTGKPVLTFTASPASTGGARAQAQLNETLIAIAARLVLRPQTVIGAVHEKMTEGRFNDSRSLAFLQAGISDLLRDVEHKASVTRQQS
jgi:chromate reductase